MKTCIEFRTLRSYTITVTLFLSTHLQSISQTFTKVTTGPLVNTARDSRSVNWIDANNDGLIDCMITNSLTAGQNNSLFLNNGTGNFTAVTGDVIVQDNKPSDGATWADTDNDGDLDCFVVNWYNVNNMYYTNNGSGTFTQITTGQMVNDAGYSETASWGDYDNDSYLDLYVTNSAGLKRNFLYHNNGNGTFTKITTGTLVTDQFDSRSVNWTDIDSDGDLDLFVTNETNQNENIYRNDGNGTFTKLTAGALLNDGGKTMSSSWGDYDNDGDLDVFLANDQGNDALFRNDGNFNFTKITSDTVSNCGGNSFSSAWSDIDNDGDIDLFVTNAFWTATLLNNFLFLNNGNGTFTRVNNTTPATDLDWSYGCAFGDYDNDGFQDLAVATVQFNSVDRPDLLYHNDGNANNWITVTLVGTVTNRAAIGTKIRVKATINGNPVWQMREISAQSSYCGQNDLRAHFGLGNATTIDSVKVEWLSGLVEYFSSVAANQFIVITEGQSLTNTYEVLNKEQVNIFPNPSSGIVTVSFADRLLGEGDKIIIANSLGETLSVYQLTSAKDKLEINLTKSGSNPSGIYLISVVTKSGTVARKNVVLK